MWTLQQKQKYLREHLDKDKFEDFFEYLGAEEVDFNIQKWSDAFTIELVGKFNRQKQEENKNLETSFYQYQANESLSAVASMILGDSFQNVGGQDTKEKPERKEENEAKEETKEENGEKSQKIVKEPKEQSAFEFLDSIFEKQNNQVDLPNDINPQHFKTHSPTVKVEVPNASQFATNQFWDIGAANRGHKVSKTATDFADFDFWSQPPSSPQHSKLDNFDVSSEKGASKKEAKNDVKKASVPSFNQLVVKCQTQKGPSPYQKKKNNYDDEPVIKETDKDKKGKTEITEKKVVHPSEQSKSSKKIKKTTKVIYDGQIILKKEFEKTVKCFPSAERSKLKDPSLRVTIEGHEIVQRTFLMPDYTMYEVKLHPLNICCKRNYEDFERLKATLTKLFPGTKLAYLESNRWFSATNLQFIKGQKVMLAFFLNDLIKNPEIRNSKILEDFLTLTDHKKIKRKFQEWDQLSAPQSIEELCLLGGYVQVNLSEEQRLYQQNFKRYHTKFVQFLQKQEKLTFTLTKQYEQIESSENSLIALIKDMMTETTYFNERVYDLQLERINVALKMMHDNYCQENKNTQFHIKMLNSVVLPFVKYEKDNVEELQQLEKKQQQFFKTYLRRSAYDSIDEKMLYISDKLKPFKNGVLEESKSLHVLKYQAGFLSNQMCVEGHRVIETLGDKYLSLFKGCGQKRKGHYQTILQFWGKHEHGHNSK